MKITNFKVTPNLVAPGENMHVEFTITIESSDTVNGLQIYGGNASTYMVYTNSSWTLAAGKSAVISIDKAVPTGLAYINDNLAASSTRTFTDPKWAIVLGNFGTRLEITNPVTYLDRSLQPAITEFSLERAADGVSNDEGENVLTTLKLSVGPYGDYSVASLKLYYAENETPTTSSSYIDLTSKISTLLTGVTDNATIITRTFSNGSNWGFLLWFGDQNENTSAQFSISRSFANVHMSGCKTGGVCCGGFSTATEGNPKFESYYPIFAYGGLEPIETVYPALRSGFSTPGDYGGTLVFRRIGKLAIISGSVKLTTAASVATICTLPEGFVPTTSHYYLAAITGSQIARISVYGSNDNASDPGCLRLEWVKKISSTSSVSATQSWIDCSTVYWIN